MQGKAAFLKSFFVVQPLGPSTWATGNMKCLCSCHRMAYHKLVTMSAVQSVLTSAGKPDALGPLDENDPEDAMEEDANDQADDLAEQLQRSARIL